MILKVFTDGASRGNPGPASYGFIIKDENGVILHQEGEVLGVNTNNFAEYTAALKAFEYIDQRLFKKSPHRVELLADSRLVVEQLNGNFKIKNPTLFGIYQKIKILESKLGSVSYKHIPRGDNFLADRMANKALDNSIK